MGNTKLVDINSLIKSIKPRRCQFNCKGFTLLELITSSALIAMLSAIAAPSFATIINNGHIKTTSLQLSNTLALARNHALTNRINVIVCHAQNSVEPKCSESRDRNTDWANGIISYADKNSNNTLDESDQILMISEHHNNVAVVFNQNGRLRFFPHGGSRSAGFYLCSEVSNIERHLKILYTGRTRAEQKMTDANREKCLSARVS